MTCEAVSFEKSISPIEIFSFWKLKIYVTEMFYEGLKKQFSWNLMQRNTVKVTKI